MIEWVKSILSTSYSFSSSNYHFIKDYNLERGSLVQKRLALNKFALISTHWALFEYANAIHVLTSDFQLIQLCNDIFDKDSLCG